MWQCGMAHVYVGATGLFMPSAHSTCGGWPEGGKKKQPLQPKPFERESLLLKKPGLKKVCMEKSGLMSLNRTSPILYYLLNFFFKAKSTKDSKEESSRRTSNMVEKTIVQNLSYDVNLIFSHTDSI